MIKKVGTKKRKPQKTGDANTLSMKDLHGHIDAGSQGVMIALII